MRLELGDARKEQIASDADHDRVNQQHQGPQEIMPDDLALTKRVVETPTVAVCGTDYRRDREFA